MYMFEIGLVKGYQIKYEIFKSKHDIYKVSTYFSEKLLPTDLFEPASSLNCTK